VFGWDQPGLIADGVVGRGSTKLALEGGALNLSSSVDVSERELVLYMDAWDWRRASSLSKDERGSDDNEGRRLASVKERGGC
jgi:hypothetical protein